MINTGNSTLDAILLTLGFLLPIFITFFITLIIVGIDEDNRNEDWNNFKFRKKK